MERSRLQGQYDSLVHRMNGGGPHLVEGRDLYHEVIQLLFASVVAAAQNPHEKNITRQFYAQVNRFTPKTVGLPAEVDLRRVITIFGNKSQFSGEAHNSSCTSCAMGFLRYVLPMELAWDLRDSQVSSYVDIGKALYAHLRKSIEKQKALMDEETIRGLGESFIHFQAFSSHDIADYYDLRIIGAQKARQLPEDTLGHFRAELAALSEMLTPEGKRIGVAIHCRDYTYALIIFDTPKGREFVFFDSHGNTALNEGNPNAYIKYTFSLEEMARFLATLFPHQPLELDASALADVKGQGGSAELESEANKYICYVMDLKPGEGVVLEELGESWEVIERSTVVGGALESSRRSSSPKVAPIKTSQHSSPASRGGVEGGGGSTPPSRINPFSIILLALLGASLYIYRKPIMNMITSFTTKMGLVSTKK